MHRRVDVAEVPLVGGDLAARVEVRLRQHQVELALGEVGVDHRQRHAVEREVPRRVPRVLPLVGHRDDVVVDHVEPRLVAAAPARRRPQRVRLVLAQPQVDVEVVALLRPQHPGQRLAHHRCRVVADGRRGDGVVELVGLGAPLRRSRSSASANGVVERRPAVAGEAQPARPPRRRPGTTRRTCAAALVPRAVRVRPSPAPWTTWSAMPSFGVRRRVVGAPQPRACSSRCRRTAARRRARRGGARSPSSWCSARTTGCAGVDPASVGFGSCGGHDHVLRNHSVGSTWIGASSRTAVVHRDPAQQVVRAGLGVARPRRRSSGRRRRRRCRSARTPSRTGSGRGSCRRGRRTGTPPAGTCRASAGSCASAGCRRRSSTP